MTPIRRLAGFLLCLGAVALIAGCTDMLRSDAENAGRQSADAKREWVRVSQIASRQAPVAQPVAGADLVKLLSGKTHVQEYRMAVADPAPYYVVYEYYQADGRYIFLDTRFRQDPDEYPADRWQVNGDVLCVVKHEAGGSTSCYKVRVEPTGVLQFWIHRPGDATDGLITYSVRTVKEGLQKPAFVRVQWPTR